MPHPTQTRREVIVAGAAAAASTVLGVMPGMAAGAAHGVVSGRVVAGDVSEAGSARGNAGLAGIRVSNGVEISITDADGHWQLPFRKGAFVFPIKPRDWAVSARANGLPFTGVALGDQPSGIPMEFGLTRRAEPRKFTVALVADVQPQTPAELGYFRDSILPVISNAGAEFALNHGDIVFDNAALYERYVQLIGATGIPWYHSPGNHDMNDYGRATRFETYKSVFGSTTFAFHYGEATFIVLNNVEPTPEGQLTPSGNDYAGRIGRDQLAFVKTLLETVPNDELVVVSLHIPLVSFDDPHDISSYTADARELMRLLSGRPNTLSLAGHTHTTEHHYLGSELGFSGPGAHHHHVLAAACGSWWSGPFDTAGSPVSLSRDGTPKGFHLLDVDGSRYTTRFVPVGNSGDSKISVAIVAPEEAASALKDDAAQFVPAGRCVSCGQAALGRIIVNVYDGGPRTLANCRIVSRASGQVSERILTMERCVEPDATAAVLFAKHRAVIRPWVTATPCSHLWSAPLPTALTTGTYTAYIEISDEYGARHSSQFIFEVTA